MLDGLDEDAVYESYQHKMGWTNRLIHGDSAQIMSSLASREDMAGEVQMVYFDPPYGISFKSTMQVATTSRQGSERKEEMSGEPEMLRTFRDTYKRGIHDYLDGIRENAVLARELLAQTGSMFLQIGDKNVHRIALILDEVFGENNRVATVTFNKSGSSPSNKLPEVADYILWYAKDKPSMTFHKLYRPRASRNEKLEAFSSYAMLEHEDGTCTNLTQSERLNPDSISTKSRIFQRAILHSQGGHSSERSKPFEWNGRVWTCRPNEQWRVSHKGLRRLASKNRLISSINSSQYGLRWKRYEDEYPGTPFHNVWAELHIPNDMHYVVETAEKVIERCILMSTDPGDLVLDITCGSGTTPFVCEKWGRRWITTDASRVPISLTRQRVLTAVHDWFILNTSKEAQDVESNYALKYQYTYKEKEAKESRDPSVGYVYERIPYVSAAQLAYDRPPKYTYLVDQPHKSKRQKHRIASAFTVESHSPYRTVPPRDYIKNEDQVDPTSAIRAALGQSGIQLQNGSRLQCRDIEPHNPVSGKGIITHFCESNLSRKNGKTKNTAVSILPDDATASHQWIQEATRLAASDSSIQRLLVIAFNFESDAITEQPLQRGRIELICARANRDLTIDTLQDTQFDQAFVQIGEPEIEVLPVKDRRKKQFTVEVKGFDTFDPKTGNLINGRSNDVDCWMLDTNYDHNAFLARRVHFPNSGGERQLKRFKKALNRHIGEEEWQAMLSLKSSPFPKPKTGKIAVRIITTTAIEMTKVYEFD